MKILYKKNARNVLQHETLSRYHIILLQFYPCSWVSPNSFKLQQRINISPLDWYSHSKYITQTHNKILYFLLFSMLFKNLQWIFVDYLRNENHFSFISLHLCQPLEQSVLNIFYLFHITLQSLLHIFSIQNYYSPYINTSIPL